MRQLTNFRFQKTLISISSTSFASAHFLVRADRGKNMHRLRARITLREFIASFDKFLTYIRGRCNVIEKTTLDRHQVVRGKGRSVQPHLPLQIPRSASMQGGWPSSISVPKIYGPGIRQAVSFTREKRLCAKYLNPIIQEAARCTEKLVKGRTIL